MLHGPYTRRAARVLLVDDTDRVLLLRFQTPTSAGWVTPGGGVEPGETLPQAAARELREEIGLATTTTSLGQPVAATAGHDELGGITGLYRDDFFFLRVHTHPVDTRGQTPHERAEHAGHRWWQLTDLTTTNDLVYPHGLAPLLADLIAGKRPAHARELPWHDYHEPTP